MTQKPSVNEFFNLGQFPKEPGIIYYGLSIPLLHNTQSPQNCYDVDLELMHKVQVSNVGAQIVYTEMGIRPIETQNSCCSFLKITPHISYKYRTYPQFHYLYVQYK